MEAQNQPVEDVEGNEEKIEDEEIDTTETKKEGI
jgi:hypothetical protein